jgi:hypothetical protein
MPDVKRYWQEVRAIEGSLPRFVWIVSIEDSLRERVGGSVAEVSAAQAGPLLWAKSHRIATEDEIRAHQAGEESAKRAALEEKRRKRGVAVVTARGE